MPIDTLLEFHDKALISINSLHAAHIPKLNLHYGIVMNTDIFCLPKFIFLMVSSRLPKGVMSWDLNLEYI